MSARSWSWTTTCGSPRSTPPTWRRCAGFRVAAEAHSAAEALPQIADTPVDLVLLDHYLPDGTGLAVVRELRRRGHQTDVIMVTAARDVATVQAAMRHGALQYLVKPFTFAGLRAKLEAYAALRRTLDGGGEAEQAEVDRIFGALSAGSEPDLPKGHSPTTAEAVRQVLLTADGPLSAQEIADRAGLSRQTAQRYLKLLERTGRVPADPAVRRDAAARNTATSGRSREPVTGGVHGLPSTECRVSTAPAPVSARTSVSACLASSGGSAEVTVPSQPARKPSGIDTTPGFCSGKTGSRRPGTGTPGCRRPPARAPPAAWPASAPRTPTTPRRAS